MRPDGIGRPGSLIASTCRSNQSFTAWLVAHTNGPASNMPATMTGHFPSGAEPADTTPQPNAHMGGNQVMGFSNSSTAEGAGRDSIATVIAARAMKRTLILTVDNVN
jgi:hypothetical protein